MSRTPPPEAEAATITPGLRDAVRRRVAGDAEVIRDTSDRAAVRRAVARALAAEGVVVAPVTWARLVRDLVDDLAGLGPLEALLRDPHVTDVVVNAPDDVWVERDGTLVPTSVAFTDADEVVAAVRRVLGPLGARLDPRSPYVDATLPGGVRLHAILPPLVPEPAVTLRRIPALVPTWDELAASGSVPPDAAEVLRRTVAARANIVVTGRAGSGKTTLLARLLHGAAADRVIVIEDAPELRLDGLHAVHLRVVPPGPDGGPDADVAVLLRNALRMRPDRLVIGEVRGAEVADLLQAMNTGHAGSMTTVHANGAADALTRLEGMALLAGIPLAAARAQVASAVDHVVTLTRDQDGSRRVAEIAEVRGDANALTARTVWP